MTALRLYCSEYRMFSRFKRRNVVNYVSPVSLSAIDSLKVKITAVEAIPVRVPFRVPFKIWFQCKPGRGRLS